MSTNQSDGTGEGSGPQPGPPADYAASIVVPAHDEAVALPSLLGSILDQDLDGQRLDVLVVDNGSVDDTMVVAQRWVERFEAAGHRLTVIRLEQASKAAALNAGDAATVVFPRLYIDADITFSAHAIRDTIELLSASAEPRLAAPALVLAPSAGRLSRSYGRLWSALPYITDQVPGAGVFGVNAAGRARWDSFPLDIGADDMFACLHFNHEEAFTARGTTFTVHLPERALELMRIRGRWTGHNLELRSRYPALAEQDGGHIASTASFIAKHPAYWRDAPAFVMVWVGGYAFAALRSLGLEGGWARASSTAARQNSGGHRTP